MFAVIHLLLGVPTSNPLRNPTQVGRPRAALALTVVACLVPGAEPYVMNFAEAWASSRALGQSGMRHFLRRAVPKGRHAAFVRCARGSGHSGYAP